MRNKKEAASGGISTSDRMAKKTFRGILQPVKYYHFQQILSSARNRKEALDEYS